MLDDGSVVTWGDAFYGGNSSFVQDQLKTVRQVQCTATAFAAILDDGSVVTWGDAIAGGDSRAVQDQLRDVRQIQSACLTFAAIRSDGSIVTWGVPQQSAGRQYVRILKCNGGGPRMSRVYTAGRREPGTLPSAPGTLPPMTVMFSEWRSPRLDPED